MSEVYDVIVVGAGVEGSATAYHLAMSGVRTLLLEQFPLPHSRGSSHGHTRITRKAYVHKDFYTNMMKESYSMMEQLQRESGEELFINCGSMVFGPRGSSYLTDFESCLRRNNLDFETFDVTGQLKRFPKLSFPADFEFIIEKCGGILWANKVLKALQQQFVQNGGILRDGEQMTEIIPGDVVTVKTARNVHRGHKVVLALGPWAAKFLPTIGVHIPLKPLKITVCYWKDKYSNEVFTEKNFPAFFTRHATDRNYCIFGHLALEYPGLIKICLHDGPEVDADRRDDVDNSWVIDAVKSAIKAHFPTLEENPSIVETCMYTNTPDRDPVLDFHPLWSNVIIAAGFSGYGFKLSPVIGKLLAQLATEQKPAYDMSHFRLNRFKKNKL